MSEICLFVIAFCSAVSAVFLMSIFFLLWRFIENQQKEKAVNNGSPCPKCGRKVVQEGDNFCIVCAHKLQV